MDKHSDHSLTSALSLVSSKTRYEIQESNPDHSSNKGKLEDCETYDLAKRRKFNEIQNDSMNRFRSNPRIKCETSSRRNLSNHGLPLTLSLFGSNRMNATCKPENFSAPSLRKPKHGAAPPSVLVEHGAAPPSALVDGPELIVMSCLNCYLHVMVSDANPKCPKCRKGDCLLDMYRGV